MKLGIRFAFSIIAFIFGLESDRAWGAPCCARSAAAPFLILTDDEAQLGFGVSGVDAVADVTDKVYFRAPNTTDFTSQFRAEGAILLSDRWQMGASLALVGRSVLPNSNPNFTLGLGDTRLSFGYEILPAWSYSVWKPQGFIFAVVTLPTGRSKYEKWDRYSDPDVTGLGFYSAALGGIFIKRWNSIDAFVIGEFHYSFPRTFTNGFVSEAVIPGFGASTGFGAGWSPSGGALRVGLRVQPRMDQLPRSQGVLVSQNPSGWITNCDTGVDLSYMLGNSETIMVSYTDQTLLGHAMNGNLNRVLALNFQHRWER